MINPFRGYLKLKDKQPCQKFGNGEPLLTLEQASKYDEYAGVLNGEFTVKDVDKGEEAQRLYQMVCDPVLRPDPPATRQTYGDLCRISPQSRSVIQQSRLLLLTWL